MLKMFNQQKGRQKGEKKSLEKAQYMMIIIKNIWEIILTVNRLHSLIKVQRLSQSKIQQYAVFKR